MVYKVRLGFIYLVILVFLSILNQISAVGNSIVYNADSDSLDFIFTVANIQHAVLEVPTTLILTGDANKVKFVGTSDNSSPLGAMTQYFVGVPFNYGIHRYISFASSATCSSTCVLRFSQSRISSSLSTTNVAIPRMVVYTGNNAAPTVLYFSLPPGYGHMPDVAAPTLNPASCSSGTTYSFTMRVTLPPSSSEVKYGRDYDSIRIILPTGVTPLTDKYPKIDGTSFQYSAPTATRAGFFFHNFSGAPGASVDVNFTDVIACPFARYAHHFYVEGYHDTKDASTRFDPYVVFRSKLAFFTSSPRSSELSCTFTPPDNYAFSHLTTVSEFVASCPVVMNDTTLFTKVDDKMTLTISSYGFSNALLSFTKQDGSATNAFTSQFVSDQSNENTLVFTITRQTAALLFTPDSNFILRVTLSSRPSFTNTATADALGFSMYLVDVSSSTTIGRVLASFPWPEAEEYPLTRHSVVDNSYFTPKTTLNDASRSITVSMTVPSIAANDIYYTFVMNNDYISTTQANSYVYTITTAAGAPCTLTYEGLVANAVKLSSNCQVANTELLVTFRVNEFYNMFRAMPVLAYVFSAHATIIIGDAPVHLATYLPLSSPALDVVATPNTNFKVVVSPASLNVPTDKLQQFSLMLYCGGTSVGSYILCNFETGTMSLDISFPPAVQDFVSMTAPDPNMLDVLCGTTSMLYTVVVNSAENHVSVRPTVDCLSATYITLKLRMRRNRTPADLSTNVLMINMLRRNAPDPAPWHPVAQYPVTLNAPLTVSAVVTPTLSGSAAPNVEKTVVLSTASTDYAPGPRSGDVLKVKPSVPWPLKGVQHGGTDVVQYGYCSDNSVVIRPLDGFTAFTTETLEFGPPTAASDTASFNVALTLADMHGQSLTASKISSGTLSGVQTITGELLINSCTGEYCSAQFILHNLPALFTSAKITITAPATTAVTGTHRFVFAAPSTIADHPVEVIRGTVGSDATFVLTLPGAVSYGDMLAITWLRLKYDTAAHTQGFRVQIAQGAVTVASTQDNILADKFWNPPAYPCQRKGPTTVAPQGSDTVQFTAPLLFDLTTTPTLTLPARAQITLPPWMAFKSFGSTCTSPSCFSPATDESLVFEVVSDEVASVRFQALGAEVETIRFDYYDDLKRFLGYALCPIPELPLYPYSITSNPTSATIASATTSSLPYTSISFTVPSAFASLTMDGFFRSVTSVSEGPYPRSKVFLGGTKTFTSAFNVKDLPAFVSRPPVAMVLLGATDKMASIFPSVSMLLPRVLPPLATTTVSPAFIHDSTISTSTLSATSLAVMSLDGAFLFTTGADADGHTVLYRYTRNLHTDPGVRSFYDGMGTLGSNPNFVSFGSDVVDAVSVSPDSEYVLVATSPVVTLHVFRNLDTGLVLMSSRDYSDRLTRVTAFAPMVLSGVYRCLLGTSTGGMYMVAFSSGADAVATILHQFTIAETVTKIAHALHITSGYNRGGFAIFFTSSRILVSTLENAPTLTAGALSSSALPATSTITAVSPVDLLADRLLFGTISGALHLLYKTGAAFSMSAPVYCSDRTMPVKSITVVPLVDAGHYIVYCLAEARQVRQFSLNGYVLTSMGSAKAYVDTDTAKNVLVDMPTPSFTGDWYRLVSSPDLTFTHVLTSTGLETFHFPAYYNSALSSACSPQSLVSHLAKQTCTLTVALDTMAAVRGDILRITLPEGSVDAECVGCTIDMPTTDRVHYRAPSIVFTVVSDVSYSVTVAITTTPYIANDAANVPFPLPDHTFSAKLFTPSLKLKAVTNTATAIRVKRHLTPQSAPTVALVGAYTSDSLYGKTSYYNFICTFTTRNVRGGGVGYRYAFQLPPGAAFDTSDQTFSKLGGYYLVGRYLSPTGTPVYVTPANVERFDIHSNSTGFIDVTISFDTVTNQRVSMTLSWRAINPPAPADDYIYPRDGSDRKVSVTFNNAETVSGYVQPYTISSGASVQQLDSLTLPAGITPTGSLTSADTQNLYLISREGYLLTYYTPRNHTETMRFVSKERICDCHLKHITATGNTGTIVVAGDDMVLYTISRLVPTLVYATALNTYKTDSTATLGDVYFNPKLHRVDLTQYTDASALLEPGVRLSAVSYIPMHDLSPSNPSWDFDSAYLVVGLSSGATVTLRSDLQTGLFDKAIPGQLPGNSTGTVSPVDSILARFDRGIAYVAELAGGVVSLHTDLTVDVWPLMGYHLSQRPVDISDASRVYWDAEAYKVQAPHTRIVDWATTPSYAGSKDTADVFIGVGDDSRIYGYRVTQSSFTRYPMEAVEVGSNDKMTSICATPDYNVLFVGGESGQIYMYSVFKVADPLNNRKRVIERLELAYTSVDGASTGTNMGEPILRVECVYDGRSVIVVSKSKVTRFSIASQFEGGTVAWQEATIQSVSTDGAALASRQAKLELTFDQDPSYFTSMLTQNYKHRMYIYLENRPLHDNRNILDVPHTPLAVQPAPAQTTTTFPTGYSFACVSLLDELGELTNNIRCDVTIPQTTFVPDMVYSLSIPVVMPNYILAGRTLITLERSIAPSDTFETSYVSVGQSNLFLMSVAKGSIAMYYRDTLLIAGSYSAGIIHFQLYITPVVKNMNAEFTVSVIEDDGLCGLSLNEDSTFDPTLIISYEDESAAAQDFFLKCEPLRRELKIRAVPDANYQDSYFPMVKSLAIRASMSFVVQTAGQGLDANGVLKIDNIVADQEYTIAVSVPTEQEITEVSYFVLEIDNTVTDNSCRLKYEGTTATRIVFAFSTADEAYGDPKITFLCKDLVAEEFSLALKQHDTQSRMIETFSVKILKVRGEVTVASVPSLVLVGRNATMRFNTSHQRPATFRLSFGNPPSSGPVCFYYNIDGTQLLRSSPVNYTIPGDSKQFELKFVCEAMHYSQDSYPVLISADLVYSDISSPSNGFKVGSVIEVYTGTKDAGKETPFPYPEDLLSDGQPHVMGAGREYPIHLLLKHRPNDYTYINVARTDGLGECAIADKEKKVFAPSNTFYIRADAPVPYSNVIIKCNTTVQTNVVQEFRVTHGSGGAPYESISFKLSPQGLVEITQSGLSSIIALQARTFTPMLVSLFPVPEDNREVTLNISNFPVANCTLHSDINAAPLYEYKITVPNVALSPDHVSMYVYCHGTTNQSVDGQMLTGSVQTGYSAFSAALKVQAIVSVVLSDESDLPSMLDVDIPLHIRVKLLTEFDGSVLFFSISTSANADPAHPDHGVCKFLGDRDADWALFHNSLPVSTARLSDPIYIRCSRITSAFQIIVTGSDPNYEIQRYVSSDITSSGSITLAYDSPTTVTTVRIKDKLGLKMQLNPKTATATQFTFEVSALGDTTDPTASICGFAEKSMDPNAAYTFVTPLTVTVDADKDAYDNVYFSCSTAAEEGPSIIISSPSYSTLYTYPISPRNYIIITRGDGRPVGEILDLNAAMQFTATAIPAVEYGTSTFTFELVNGNGCFVGPDETAAASTWASPLTQGHGVIQFIVKCTNADTVGPYLRVSSNTLYLTETTPNMAVSGTLRFILAGSTTPFDFKLDLNHTAIINVYTNPGPPTDTSLTLRLTDAPGACAMAYLPDWTPDTILDNAAVPWVFAEAADFKNWPDDYLTNKVDAVHSIDFTLLAGANAPVGALVLHCRELIPTINGGGGPIMSVVQNPTGSPNELKFGDLASEPLLIYGSMVYTKHPDGEFDNPLKAGLPINSFVTLDPPVPMATELRFSVDHPTNGDCNFQNDDASAFDADTLTYSIPTNEITSTAIILKCLNVHGVGTSISVAVIQGPLYRTAVISQRPVLGYIDLKYNNTNVFPSSLDRLTNLVSISAATVVQLVIEFPVLIQDATPLVYNVWAVGDGTCSFAQIEASPSYATNATLSYSSADTVNVAHVSFYMRCGSPAFKMENAELPRITIQRKSGPNFSNFLAEGFEVMPSSCPPLTVPTNGLAPSVTDGGYGAYNYNSVATYSCVNGFRVSSGNAMRTCSANGWTGTDPVCSPVDCGPIQALDTQVDTSTITYTPSVHGNTKFNAKVAYRCALGFVTQQTGRVTTGERTCESTGKWSTYNLCSPIDCGALPNIADGGPSIYANDTAYPATRGYGPRLLDNYGYYTCNNGFELRSTTRLDPVIVNTTHVESPLGSATCTVNEWENYVEPDGGFVYCHSLDCRQLSIEEGSGLSVVYDKELDISQVPAVFPLDTIATYTCAEGFDVSDEGLRSRTCASDGWSSKAPSCIPKKCPLRPNLVNGSPPSYSGITYGVDPHYGSSASFTCSWGFELRGAAELFCNSAGAWEPVGGGAEPSCVVKQCSLLPEIPNSGPYVYNEDGYSGVLTHLSTARFTCATGFDISGSSDRTCEDGTWVPITNNPVCSAHNCGVLPMVENLLSITYTDGGWGKYAFLATAQYTCATGFSLAGVSSDTRECRASGWSGSTPRCSAFNCGPIPQGKYSRVVSYTDNGNGITSLGASASFGCAKGFRLKGTTSQSTCQATGWSVPDHPECEDINECAENPNICAAYGAASECVNYVGGYACSPYIHASSMKGGSSVVVAQTSATVSSTVPTASDAIFFSYYPGRGVAGLATGETVRSIIYEHPVYPGLSFPCKVLNRTHTTVYGISCQPSNGVGKDLLIKLQFAVVDYDNVETLVWTVFNPSTASAAAKLSYYSINYPPPTLTPQSLRSLSYTSSIGTTNLVGTTAVGEKIQMYGTNFTTGATADMIKITYAPMIEVNGVMVYDEANARPCALLPESTHATAVACEMGNDNGINLVFSVWVGGHVVRSTDSFSYPIEPLVFRVEGCPTVDDVTGFATDCPTSGGNILTIYGQGFLIPTTITINSNDCKLSGDSYTDQVFHCVLPAGTGQSLSLIVTAAAWTRENYDFLSYATPTITQLSTPNDKGCDRVVDTTTKLINCDRNGNVTLIIEGNNFGSEGATIYVGGSTCANSYHDENTPHNKIYCTLSSGSLNDRSVVVQQRYGELSVSEASISYAQCAAGTYDRDNQCYPCAPGSYSDSIAQSECKPCSPGSYNNATTSGADSATRGFTSCFSCPAGTYSPQGRPECYVCPRGTFSTGNAGSCSTCPSGTFAPNTNTISCESCLYGGTSDDDYAGCHCQTGFYMSEDNTCVPCVTGANCIEGGRTLYNVLPLPGYYPEVITSDRPVLARISFDYAVDANLSDSYSRAVFRDRWFRALFDGTNLNRNRVSTYSTTTERVLQTDYAPSLSDMLNGATQQVQQFMTSNGMKFTTNANIQAFKGDPRPVVDFYHAPKPFKAARTTALPVPRDGFAPKADDDHKYTTGVRIMVDILPPDNVDKTPISDYYNMLLKIIETKDSYMEQNFNPFLTAINVHQEYRRAAVYNFVACLNDACVGGLQQCAPGYTGTLCAVCESGYGKSSTFGCTKCNDVQVRVMYKVMYIIIALATVGILSGLNVYEATTTRLVPEVVQPISYAVYARILICAVQVFGIASRYEIDWPGVLGKTMSALDEVGNMGVGIVELDCFSDQYGMMIRPFLATSLATAMLPIIAFLLPASVLFPWYLLKSQRYRNILGRLGHVRIYLDQQRKESTLASQTFQAQYEKELAEVKKAEQAVIDDEIGRSKGAAALAAIQAKASKSTFESTIDSGEDDERTETQTAPLPPPAHPPHLDLLYGDSDSDDDMEPAPLAQGVAVRYTAAQAAELQFQTDLPDVDGLQADDSKMHVAFTEDTIDKEVRKDNKRLARKRFNGGPQLSLRGVSTKASGARNYTNAYVYSHNNPEGLVHRQARDTAYKEMDRNGSFYSGDTYNIFSCCRSQTTDASGVDDTKSMSKKELQAALNGDAVLYRRLHADKRIYMNTLAEWETTRSFFMWVLVSGVIITFYLFHPNICRTFFLLYACKNVGDISVVNADMTIQCFSVDHILWMTCLGLPMLVWIVFVPIFFFRYLRKNQILIETKWPDIFHTLIEEKYKLELGFGFLYKGFHPHLYWWWLLEMARKMLYIAVSIFFPGEMNIQLLMASFVAFMAISAQTAAKPYQNSYHESLDFFALLAAFNIFFIANFYTIEGESLETSQIYITIAITASTFAFFGVTAIIFVLIFKANMQMSGIYNTVRRAVRRRVNPMRFVREWRKTQRDEELRRRTIAMKEEEARKAKANAIESMRDKAKGISNGVGSAADNYEDVKKTYVIDDHSDNDSITREKNLHKAQLPKPKLEHFTPSASAVKALDGEIELVPLDHETAFRKAKQAADSTSEHSDDDQAAGYDNDNPTAAKNPFSEEDLLAKRKQKEEEELRSKLEDLVFDTNADDDNILEEVNKDLHLDQYGMVRRDRKAERRKKRRERQQRRELERARALGLTHSESDDEDAIEELAVVDTIAMQRAQTHTSQYAIHDDPYYQLAHMRALPMNDEVLSSSEDSEEGVNTLARQQQSRINYALNEQRFGSNKSATV